jgi:hypothetical protein
MFPKSLDIGISFQERYVGFLGGQVVYYCMQISSIIFVMQGFVCLFILPCEFIFEPKLLN